MINRLLIFAIALTSSCIVSAFAFASTHQPLLTGYESAHRTSATQVGIIDDSNTKRLRIHNNILASTNNPDDEKEDANAKKSISDEIFWAKQRALAAQMEANSDESLRQEQLEKFRRRSFALVSDTFYFSILIASLLWLVAPNPFVAISYLFGALAGTAYSYGLGKYVETIGGSIDDAEAGEGAGVGSARFAFLILLFVVVGKFRSQGLLEIPSIMGFFTYQLASLGQGLREIDD